jgi:biopolymer transport protein ExbD
MSLLRIRLSSELSDEGAESEINMAPLIDMVFILLIFFLVTTSFIRESGVKVDRPRAVTGQAVQKRSFMVGLEKGGRIFADNHPVELSSVRGLVERFLAEEPGGAVVVVADRETLTGRVVEVVDQCRLAGARDVAVATERPAS